MKLFRMRELIEQLNEASDAYYNRSNPIMEDKEWDSLFDELKALEQESGIIMSNSPTQNVGFEVKSELQKVTHSSPMMSLDKTKDLATLQDYCKGRPCVLSLKMDGLTIRLTYQDGDLVRAETRGNGEIGEDVTHNARQIKNIPLHINHPGEYVIEGECIITYEDFEKINEKLPKDKKFKNPRNLASGSIRQLDSKIAAERNLKFVAWKVVGGDESGSFEERMDNAKIKYGFDCVVRDWFSSSKGITELYVKRLQQFAKSEGLPIDGLVLTFNDVTYGESLGMTGHHPRHSLAFKFSNEGETTKLRDIEWTMGKTGELTPVAIFDPVKLYGTKVNRASLHNLSVMESLSDTYYKGIELTVTKANEIIPMVIEVNGDIEDGVAYEFLPIPNICPKCGSPTEVKTTDESKILCCTNPNCKGILAGKLSSFVSRDRMDIRGISDKTLELLVENDLVTKYSDLYHLKEKPAYLHRLPGHGPKKVENMLDAIEASRETTLDRFIAALNIPMVGRSAAKIIMNNTDGPDDFLEKWKSGYRWSNFQDIGETMERNLNAYAKSNWADIVELLQEIHIKGSENDESQNQSQVLEGKTFVVTGKVEHFKNRDELKAFIVERGGKVSGSVSSKTFALINNDVTSTSGKNKKAKELGIPIWSEKDFLKFTA